MFRGKDVEEISELKREGLSIHAISRLTGFRRGTISVFIGADRHRSMDRDRRQWANWIPSSHI